MTFEITKDNKQTLKVLFIKHLLNGGTIFTVDRDNGKIVEVVGFSLKTRRFRWRYQDHKTVSAHWSISVGETYSFESYKLFTEQATIISKKMR